jgi:hypothetical protein
MRTLEGKNMTKLETPRLLAGYRSRNNMGNATTGQQLRANAIEGSQRY